MAPINDENNGSPSVTVLGGKQQYLIAATRGLEAARANIQPLSVHAFSAAIDSMNLEIVRRFNVSGGALERMGAGGESSEVVVAKIEPLRAHVMRATLPPHFLMSEDKPLNYGGVLRPLEATPGIWPSPLVGMNMTRREIPFRVIDEEGKPVARATVELTGDGFPQQGETNASGEVRLELLTVGTGPARAVFVATSSSYWDFYANRPALSENAINTIVLRSLKATVPQFPGGFKLGWGQRAMGLDQIPRELGGQGVKIAIIDSGCDTTHPLLAHIQRGHDFTGSGNPAAWNQDLLGHGTHCAGIIGARPTDSLPMRGFAPDAEIHVLRIFPGGDYNTLIEAIDYCIRQGIDIINLSLGGTTEDNPVVEQSLELAIMNGIGCIVAAGNSGDAVRYPAKSPRTLAVAAIGNINEVPSDSWEITTVQSGLMANDGVFSPTFSCFGPEIQVAAPGVGIISTIPNGQFEPQSGTSMAAPHVTGMAALLLAHHPIFQTQLRERTASRVRALFDMLTSNTAAYGFGTHTGAGLPRLHEFMNILGQAAAPDARAPGRNLSPFASGPMYPFAWPNVGDPWGTWWQARRYY